MLFIQPRGGLGNRLRAIDSARALAAEIEHELVIIWNSGPEMGADFLDLFEPIAGIGVVHGEVVRAREPIIHLSQQRVGELRKADFSFASLREYATIIIETWDRFYPPRNPFAMFVPTAALRDRVAELTARFDQTIGVHIRRTDHKKARADSPTEAFLRRMRTALDTGEARSFFLATDDPAEEVALRTAFGGAIITQAKRSLERSEREAIEDAVVDLYALAATRQILGSTGSSFSDAAAGIGRIKLERARAASSSAVPR